MLDQPSEMMQPYASVTIRVPVRRVNPVTDWQIWCSECERMKSARGAREILIGNNDVLVCRSCWEGFAV